MSNGIEFSASAPGKVIISGEHFVVHGSYAVAAAINRRATVTVRPSAGGEPSTISSKGRTAQLDSSDHFFSAARTVARKTLSYLNSRDHVEISINSDIPPGSGLGSSAAVSSATCAAIAGFLGRDIEKSEIFEIASHGEREVHGNPSGVDTQTSILGGLILFRKDKGAKEVIPNHPIKLLIAYSGKQRKTADLIVKVRKQRHMHPNFFDHLVKSSSIMSLEVVKSAISCDLPYLGALMNFMQTSLDWIGVSTPSLERLIEDALTVDVYGAKITGAGGGGSIIALPRPERANSLMKKVSSKHPESFLCTIPQQGLRMEGTT